MNYYHAIKSSSSGGIINNSTRNIPSVTSSQQRVLGLCVQELEQEHFNEMVKCVGEKFNSPQSVLVVTFGETRFSNCLGRGMRGGGEGGEGVGGTDKL